MRDKIVDVMPEMKTGKELLDCLRETPEYPACIWEKSSMERLVALSDIYNVYIPSRMSVEIYHKLYMGLLRSMQKKESMQAVYQKYENQRGIRGGRCRGILGGSDSFTILGASGIGKSSAVFRAIDLIMTKKVKEIEEPYCRIAPCIIVQCPFDSSVKGLLLEILRKVDEVLGSKYYVNALKARASVDMLIGSVSQVSLNHIGLLVVDEIQNVVNSRNGKSLVGMLTQLINNSGIAICMVGTPESIPFFEQAMQLARRSLRYFRRNVQRAILSPRPITPSWSSYTDRGTVPCIPHRTHPQTAWLHTAIPETVLPAALPVQRTGCSPVSLPYR